MGTTCRPGIKASMLILLAAGLWAPPAQAVLVDVTVTGVVDKVVNAVVDTQFDVGDLMSATLTFDAATLPEPSLILTQALYKQAITGGSFQVDGYSGTVPGGNINIENDDPTFFDAIAWRGGANGPPIGTMNPVDFVIALSDPLAATINSLALPLTTADVVGFPEQRWGLSFGISLNTDPPGVSGPIRSITLTMHPNLVPEPTTATATLMGLLALTLRRRRRA